MEHTLSVLLYTVAIKNTQEKVDKFYTTSLRHE